MPRILVSEKELSAARKKLKKFKRLISVHALSKIVSKNWPKEKFRELLPILAKKYNASIIGLTMDKAGIPKDSEGRMELAMKMVAACMEYGIDVSELYLDAVILPINVGQSHVKEVLKTIRDSKLLSDPSPKTVLGLSNVSQGSSARYKSLINRTFLAMAIANGLDAAILDVTDKELMDNLITAELLMEKQLYCESYLDAYKKM